MFTKQLKKRVAAIMTIVFLLTMFPSNILSISTEIAAIEETTASGTLAESQPLSAGAGSTSGNASSESASSSSEQVSSSPETSATNPTTSASEVSASEVQESSSAVSSTSTPTVSATAEVFSKGYAKVLTDKLALLYPSPSDFSFARNAVVYVDGVSGTNLKVYFRTAEGEFNGQLPSTELKELSESERAAFLQKELAQSDLLYYKGDTSLPLPLLSNAAATETSSAVSSPSSSAGSTDSTTDSITDSTTDPTSYPTDPSNTGTTSSSVEGRSESSSTNTAESTSETTSEKTTETTASSSTTSTPQVPALDPSIRLNLTGNALFLTDTAGQLQLKLEKAADSIEQGPALLNIRIEDRYLQEIVAAEIPGAVQTLSRDSASETTLISYKLDKLSPGTVLTSTIDFHVANAEIPQDYRFAVQLSLEAIITNTTKTTETSTAPLRTMAKASSPLSLNANDTQPAALTEPQSFTFALLNVTNLTASPGLSLSNNLILPKGQEAEIVVTQTGPGGTATIPGPATLEVEFTDVSAIESIIVPQGATMSPETLASPTTISLPLPDGVASDAVISLPIRLKSLAAVAEASTIPVTARLKFDLDGTVMQTSTATYTLYSQDMSLTGPGTFRIGADV